MYTLKILKRLQYIELNSEHQVLSEIVNYENISTV